KCWSQFAATIAVLPDKTPCSICSRRTITRVYDLRIPGAVPRCETLCPSCSSIEDSPIDRRTSMSVQPDGLMQLHGSLPRSNWQARSPAGGSFRRETFRWEWPAAPTGEPLQSFRVPQAWPVVPFRLSVIMVHGDSEFTVLGCLFRGSQQNE